MPFTKRNKYSLISSVTVLTLTFLLVLTACNKDEEEEEVNNPTPSDTTAAEIAEVRSHTAPYVEHSVAVADGWDTALSECVEHPEEGGMGYHYGRMEYIDGRVNHLEPQVLLYGPSENGLDFLGVEYIVPFAILGPDAEAPVLFGHSFHANHAQEIWALHVWTEKENPNGMFYDWNPDVSCD